MPWPPTTARCRTTSRRSTAPARWSRATAGATGYLRGAASTLDAALTERGVEHDVKEYPDAGHAFLNETANAPWYAAPMSRLVMRVGPEPASAQDAWGRIEAFLGRHLTR